MRLSATSRATRAAAAALAAILNLTACDRGAPEQSGKPPAVATYVGAAKCSACHAEQAQTWRASHHALAMLPATQENVRGDFADATFTKDGVESRFFQREGAYYVHTDGADGKLADFRVSYTFGVEPLQQYLVEFPDGRLQALGIAWDTRPEEQGGQRWFDLYPKEHIDYRDVLHWTGPAQNWNHMCAECHSTNLQKKFHADTNRFASTWTDVSVACEACHGPGSNHVAWAEARTRKQDPSHGLVFTLDDYSSGAWAFAPREPIARRNAPLTEHREVEMCARCHSRRAQIWPDYHHGEVLAQGYRVALLEPGLYHADGQIRDEVYEYGSFLQSRMYAAGVTCSNCHEPHSGRLRAEGNAVCTQCHEAATFDTPRHHFHETAGASQQCVSCHMGERYYMIVDGRRDHSFRVPRPDLTVALGTPNACTDCHSKQSAQWAAKAIDKWYGTERGDSRAHAEAFAAAEKSSAEAEKLLAEAATDLAAAPFVRASALERLTPFLTQQSFAIVEKALHDSDALIRRSAAEALAAADPGVRTALATPLLADPIRTVRLEALGALLDSDLSRLSTTQEQAIDQAIQEYRAIQLSNADRADAQTNLGMLEARLGNRIDAERAFTTAIRLQPSFIPARVNLADLYRAQEREEEAEQQLRQAIELAPYNADAHEALGLALVRQGLLREALNELAHAAQLAPEIARYSYVHAIALREAGKLPSAISVLEEAHKRHPSERALLSALVEFNLQAQDRDAALKWARQFVALAPDDPGAKQLLEQLEGKPAQ